MKTDAVAFGIAGILFGLIAGWIIGSQQAAGRPPVVLGGLRRLGPTASALASIRGSGQPEAEDHAGVGQHAGSVTAGTAGRSWVRHAAGGWAETSARHVKEVPTWPPRRSRHSTTAG